MRLLHTGDWHIGKRLYGVDRLREFAAALDEVAQIAADNDVDAILMSGDIMDRRIVEPLMLSTCLQSLERLAQVAPVVAITGNHDEPLFWAEIAPYLAPRILLAASEAVFGVETEAGRLTVACMPWPEPAEAPALAGETRGTSRAAYTDLVVERLQGLATQAATAHGTRDGACVLLAHVMVKGGVSGGGERELTLAGTYAVPGAAFPDIFEYVALGHLHQPQMLRAIPTTGRYCGSPLALDFSGDGASPSVTLVDIDDGVVQVTEVPTTAGRRLIRLRGTLDELPTLAAEHDNAWFFCEVETDGIRLDVVREVRDRIPSALRVEQIGDAAPAPSAPQTDEQIARSLPDMYERWLASTGRAVDPDLIRAFADAVERATD